MKKSIFAAILVTLQFAAIFSIIFRTGFSIEINFGNILITLSLLTGFWALYTMKKSKFTISPIPREKAQLVEDGLYRYIRHPMYLAVLLLCSGLLIQRPDPVNISVFIILTVDLLIKLHWEEKLLAEKFEDYASYRLRTKKIIPFIY